MRIGLALGGGGARGLAHLGTLRALADAGIKPTVIAGTSMGATIGVGYSQEMNHQDLFTKYREFVLQFGERFSSMNYLETNKKKEASSLFHIIRAFTEKAKLARFAGKLHLESRTILEEIATHFIHPCNLEDLSTPVFAMTLDVASGKGILLNQGSAQLAIQAATSIAGYFPGLELAGMTLYDAQHVFPVPIQAFQFAEVDMIIACPVGLPIAARFKPRNVVDLLFRQSEISYNHIISEVTNCSDVVIQPELEDIHWTEFAKMDTLAERGYKATQQAIPRIRDLLEERQPTIPRDKRPWHNSGYKDNERLSLAGFPAVEQ